MYFSLNQSKKESFHSDYLDEDIVDFLGGTFSIPASYDAALVPVDDGYEARPDLVAAELYMDEMHMDVICKLNGIGNPFELNVDDQLVMPIEADLYNFAVQPAPQWSEAKSALLIHRPKPVKRSQKRKPNEAVVGDKRFNIDPLSKIVIY